MKIIIVDDEKDMLNLLADILRGEGYEIATANNAPEFMKVADEQTIPPNLVITDLDMPALNGFGVIFQTRSRWGGEIPIIVVSAGLQDNKERMNRCLQETSYIVHKGPDFNINDFKRIVGIAVANSGQKQAVPA
jgi:DNA-binding response OmpR family regulator